MKKILKIGNTFTACFAGLLLCGCSPEPLTDKQVEWLSKSCTAQDMVLYVRTTASQNTARCVAVKSPLKIE